MISLSPSIVPSDSLLQHWLKAQSIIEPPLSFDLAVGIATIGALLRRSCWFDQTLWKVWPNQSILLVGPSGIGKDTAINAAADVLAEIGLVRIIGGKTSEALLEALYRIGDPATAVVLAQEFSDFFGSKDYQKGMIESMTNVLSSGKEISIGLKSAMGKKIKNPTVTMLGGSTRDWLHKAMPEEAMTGGFYPRFLILHEDKPKRHVALIKYDIPKAELIEAMTAKAEFTKGLLTLVSYSDTIGEVRIDGAAQDQYREFYASRLKFFSPNAQAYANRCRDTVLRIAMISAVSRFCDTINPADMKFAVDLISYVGEHIDEALAPPTMHLRIVRDALQMLPATRQYLFRNLEQKYDRFHIKNALESMLMDSGRMSYDEQKKVYYAVDQQVHREVNN